jgi:hypothetical protein
MCEAVIYSTVVLFETEVNPSHPVFLLYTVVATNVRASPEGYRMPFVYCELYVQIFGAYDYYET